MSWISQKPSIGEKVLDRFSVSGHMCRGRVPVSWFGTGKVNYILLIRFLIANNWLLLYDRILILDFDDISFRVGWVLKGVDTDTGNIYCGNFFSIAEPLGVKNCLRCFWHIINRKSIMPESGCARGEFETLQHVLVAENLKFWSSIPLSWQEQMFPSYVRTYEVSHFVNPSTRQDPLRWDWNATKDFLIKGEELSFFCNQVCMGKFYRYDWIPENSLFKVIQHP